MILHLKRLKLKDKLKRIFKTLFERFFLKSKFKENAISI